MIGVAEYCRGRISNVQNTTESETIAPKQVQYNKNRRSLECWRQRSELDLAK